MSQPTEKKPLGYKDAGVDIHAGNELVEKIKPLVKQTHRPEVLGSLGGFSGLCQIPAGYQEPILVTCTDGVGTKLKLAMEANNHRTIGIDLVAMCVNDLIVCGAEPLVFLDYYATGKLNVDLASDVISGISQGCQQAGCALIGGETAEMPGMYQQEDYDLAGFSVGIVEKSNIIDGSKIQAGDQLIGINSSGPHSNGYSLIRKIIEVNQIDLLSDFNGQSLADTLLAPTKIYVKSLLQILKEHAIHGLAHITGGGLLENLPRILPQGLVATINSQTWQRPAIFDWLQQQGNIDDEEMYRTFNCGIGMVLCVPAQTADNIIQLLKQLGEDAQLIGKIVQQNNQSSHQIEIIS